MATYHQKKVVSDEFFVLYAGKNKNLETTATKFGFVVSKKVHKRAVVRNKIKRRMREAVMYYIRENNPSYMSAILSAKTGSENLLYEDVLKRITILLDRIAIKKF